MSGDQDSILENFKPVINQITQFVKMHNLVNGNHIFSYVHCSINFTRNIFDCDQSNVYCSLQLSVPSRP